MTVGILEKPGSRLSICITQILKKCDNCADTVVKTGSSPNAFFSAVPELLVVFRNIGRERELIFPESVILIPERPKGEKIVAKSVYTYGMGEDDDITYSSIADIKKVISIQRELLPLAGAVVERQDIPLSQVWDMNNDELLAASAALIILGVPPEKLRAVL